MSRCHGSKPAAAVSCLYNDERLSFPLRACSVEDARSAEEAVKALGNLAANENHAHKIVEGLMSGGDGFMRWVLVEP